VAKQNGLGARFLSGGYDISGDVQALDQVAGGPEMLDVTDITESAHARLGGLRDGHLGFTVFMDAANAHPVLAALPRTDTLLTALLPTLAVGGAAACLNSKEIDYAGTRSNKGDLTLKVQGEGNGFGLEWGTALTAGLRTDTAAANGASLNNGGATAFGAQAYLQVTAFTGTTITVAVQDSADNSTFAAVTGLTFTAVTAAPAAQRLATANTATIRQYVRVVTTGTFSSATFAVVLCRNPVAGVSF
jgi:hypothetical protein